MRKVSLLGTQAIWPATAPSPPPVSWPTNIDPAGCPLLRRGGERVGCPSVAWRPR